MSGQTDDSEKEHAASQKKLDDARKQGDVAKSMDLVGATVLIGLLLAINLGSPLLSQALTSLQMLLSHATSISKEFVQSAPIVLATVLGPTLLYLLVVIALPGSLALLTLIAQRAIVFAPDKLNPKLSRISPFEMAKQKFGADGLFEFGKSLTKLLLIAGFLAWFLQGRMDEILATAAMEPRIALMLLARLLAQFTAIIIVLLFGIGMVDLLWQNHARQKRNRMSRKEVQDEHKESDGDPHAKAERKQRAQEIAMNQLAAEVAKASVVIVNPTHYAVALAWHRGSPLPPVVLAKGVDDIALHIRDVAKRQGIPIHSNPPTARAIYAAIPVGSPIIKEHFKAVAAAMRFAELMRQKAGARAK